MHLSRLALIVPLTLALAACGQEDPEGLAVLGYGSDAAASVDLQVMLDSSDGLNRPRDLAFNPEVPGELWVVNFNDDSVTIVDDAGGPDQASENLIDPYALHFMEKVSSIDFGQPGTFGTCQESRNTYNDQAPPNDFMGPALWSSDREVFAKSNQAAVDYLTQLFGQPTDLGSHLDMQHETPLCTGLAWQEANVYWTYDGLNETIDRVDFGLDHGPGYDDHSDGITAEYIPGEIGYLEGVPNHMVYDANTQLLTVADPANNRIVQLDTTTGTRGADLPVTEPGTEHYEMNDATLTVLVGADAGLEKPSGLARVDDVLFVTDYETGFIHGFDAFTGEPLGRLFTGRTEGALQGIVAVSLDELWVVDAEEDEVFRIRPALEE